MTAPAPSTTSRPAARDGRRLRALYVCKASYHHFHYRYSPSNVARLVSAVREHDFVFAWFASPMAALAVLAAERFGKKSIIVAGGYDVADYAPLKHGMAHRPLQRPAGVQHVARRGGP